MGGGLESPKSAILGFRTGNLGDDLQSVAAALSLPFVDCMVERDRLADARLATPHVCIMNSWFTRQWLRPPSRFIQPLFHGFCFGRREMRYGLWRRYLRRHGSIGCRDTGSVAQLAAMGVAGHWTGCLTLHLGRWLAPVPAEERSGVLLVDLDPAVETYLPKRIRERSRRLTNFVPDEIVDDPLARMSRIARICDELRRAELVVTRRLHTALPCVGFSTPTVVYLSNTRANRHRFSGYETMFPFHLHGEGASPGEFGTSAVAPATIPRELGERYDALLAVVGARLGSVPAGKSASLYKKIRLECPNPGLGDGGGSVAIDFGMIKVERPAERWTAERIAVTLDAFASFERFRMPVLVRPRSGGDWREVGRVDTLATRSA